MLLHLGDQHGGSYSVAEVKNFLSEDLYDYFDTPWKSLKKKIWHIEWNHNLHRRVWGSENDEVIHVIYSALNHFIRNVMLVLISARSRQAMVSRISGLAA